MCRISCQPQRCLCIKILPSYALCPWWTVDTTCVQRVSDMTTIFKPMFKPCCCSEPCCQDLKADLCLFQQRLRQANQQPWCSDLFSTLRPGAESNSQWLRKLHSSFSSSNPKFSPSKHAYAHILPGLEGCLGSWVLSSRGWAESCPSHAGAAALVCSTTKAVLG
jgi:hypothetical protein